MKLIPFCALLFILYFAKGTHHEWNQSRNQTGYDTYTTVADGKPLNSHHFLKSELESLSDRFKGDRQKCRDTGFLETSKGAAHMYESIYYNYIEGELGLGTAHLPPNVTKFVNDQMTWMHEQVKEHTDTVFEKDGNLFQTINGQTQPISKETEYWLGVDCVLLWIQGMWEGLVVSKTNLSYDQFIALPYMGDMEDILAAKGGNEFRNKQAMDIQTLKKEMGDCTIIVKDTQDDILVAHNTHNVYSIMLRLFKTTTIEWDTYKSFMKTQTMRFSGRYGAIGSKDDYYVLSNGLIVMETSILISNSSLYSLIEPSSVPYFVRVTLANWMSKDNKGWIDVFTQYNSGTHVAQWVLIDTNKSKYQNNAIMVLDSIMGMNKAFDVTKEFKSKGYWAGYNVPYDQEIFQICGYDPVHHSYTTEERARVIKQHIDDVETPEDLKHLIRFNDNTTYPCGNISPRCDLNSGSDGRGFGAIDSKYTQRSWVKGGNLTFEAVVAPSFENPDFPPFSFTDAYNSIPHRDTPSVYNFTWGWV